MKIVLRHEIAKEKLGLFRFPLFYPLIIAVKFLGFPPTFNMKRAKRDMFVFNELIKTNPKNFLEIGSGYGRMALSLCKKINAMGICVDADFRDIETLKQLAKVLSLNCEGIAEDIFKVKFQEETFNLIYCIELIEHIKEDRKLIVLIYKWLKPSGTFIFQTPFHFVQIPDHTAHQFGHVRNGYSQEKFEDINNGLFDFKFYKYGQRKECEWCLDYKDTIHPLKLIGIGKKK